MAIPRSAVRVRYTGDDLRITYQHTLTGYAWAAAVDPDKPSDVGDLRVMVFAPDDEPEARFEVYDDKLEDLGEGEEYRRR